MLENPSNMRIITLKDLWEIFLKRVWAMVLGAIIVIIFFFSIITLTFVPRYESTATLYILRDRDSLQSAQTESTDFSLALEVVNDCTYLLKGHAIVDNVIERMGLDTTYEELSRSITTNNPESTRILEVTVEADSPEKAKAIVDELCKIGADSIEDAMGFRQVNVYERGTLNPKPCNQTSIITYILIGIAVAVLLYFVFLIQFLVDDRIHSDEDIKKYLGLSVLGDIPNSNQKNKKGYGYYRYGNTRKKLNKQSKKRGR